MGAFGTLGFFCLGIGLIGLSFRLGIGLIVDFLETAAAHLAFWVLGSELGVFSRSVEGRVSLFCFVIHVVFELLTVASVERVHFW